MEKIITIICSIILFILLIFNVDSYPDMILAVSSILLLALYIFYLFIYRKKYIDKSIIIISIISVVLQIILLYIFKNTGIWEVSSGYMGLGGGSFGLLLYFVVYTLHIILLLITNVVKYLIKIK